MKRTKTVLAVILCIVMGMMLLGGCGNQEKPVSKKTHDKQTHMVAGKEESCAHNFVNGACTLCDQKTIFRQEAMATSKEILNYQAAEGHRGSIVEIWYKTRAYGVEEQKPEFEGKLHIVKRAYVYLPAGYDANDTSKKYNVLYKMHGNKLNEGYWFRQGSYADQSAWSAYTAGYGTENMLDYMYDNNMIEDTIIVTPTMYQYYYNDKKGDVLGGDAEVGNIYFGYIDPDFERIEAAVSKDEGVLCGIDVAMRVFTLLDERVKCRVFIHDGEMVQKGDIITGFFQITDNMRGHQNRMIFLFGEIHENINDIISHNRIQTTGRFV